MVTITGSKGSHGTNGASPTDGGLGEDKSLTQNGALGLDTYTYVIRGGEGGDGGNGTGADGANGGTGGNATINVNGNIFNNAATTNLTVSLTAQGGDGGLAGTGSLGFNPGMMGNGGNADVTVNGNILQPNKNMNNIVLEAIAIGGHGPMNGNANATLSGNVVQVPKANNVTLTASARTNDPSNSTFNDGDSNFGTKTATLTGNVVQGNVTNVTLKSEAKYSNGAATLSGNIVQDTATSGKVTLEATGQHIAIENNKVQVGKNQEFDLTINQLDPIYDTVIKGNEFTGSSTNNTFVFTDNGFSDINTPSLSPTPDTIVIDLMSETFTFNGNSNVLKNFNNVTVQGNNDPTIIGNNNANILTAGGADDFLYGNGGNDTLRGMGGNDLLVGGADNDIIDGGDGDFDTAVYTGNYADYTKSFIHTGDLHGTITDNVPGRDGTDTVKNVEFLKFADGLYDVVNDQFIPDSGTNHEPVGTNKTVNTNEDTGYTFTVADFGFSDPNDAPANSFLAVKITTLPANGSLKNNGVAITAGQFVSVADIAANKLVFTPAANANGANYANFTFQVQDNGGTGGGGVDLDQSPNTMTIDVTAVNDAPAGTDKTVNSLVNTAYTFTAADFGFSDPNDTPANSFLAVKITTLPANGTLTLSGNPVVAGQFITVANIPNLAFTPALNGSGANYANFTFQVQDNGGTLNGGVDLDQSPNTITFNVGTINHEPVGANNSIAVLEDGSHTFTAAEFGFSDPNDTPANTFFAVKITTLPANGTLTLSGNPVVTGQSITVANIPNLVFTPAANANGLGYGNFTFQVQDNGGTAGGGVDLDQSPNTMTIDVTPVNDAPAGANNSIAILEDGSHTFSAAEFGFTDPNDSPANSFLAVTITTLPANGTLTLSGNPVVAGQSITVANIPNLVFTPAANANGNGYGNFTFQVQDNGGTLNGGVDLDQSPNLMTINVTAVNDAPAGADKTITMNEDGNYVFTVADFGFSDPNDTPANSLQGVKITTLPANGTLYNGPTQVLLGETISFADINSGLLHFTPAANANGLGYGNFTFQVQDNGGTLNGGVDLDQSPNLMTINVASVNDAPAGTNNSIAVLEDGSHTFSAAEFGFTDPNDTPANSFLAVTITTLPANGTLTLSGNPVVAGQSITVANIPNLVFTPAANANGLGYGNFTFQVQDNGGTLNGGVDLDQSPNTMAINVTSVNDAPAGADNSIAILEDGSHTFSAAEFGFTDPNDTPANSLQAVIITTLPANGTLTLSGNPVVAGQSISAANIPNLVFTPAANASGTGYGNFTFQVQDNGGTLNGGVDTDQSPNTMAINVTSVNDAPAGTDNAFNMAANGSHAFTTAEFGFTDPNDSPANSLQAVIITTLPANGSLTLNGNAVNAGDSISAVDITAGNLVFTPAPNMFGMGYGNFTFQVQDNGGTANGGVDTDQSPNTMTVNVSPLLIVGNQPGDYATIQDAIDAANPGDTVYIRAGIYQGPGNSDINVNKAGLTIQALSGPGTVTIEGDFSNVNSFANTDGDPSGLAVWLQTHGYTATGNGINVSANNVTLKDLKINDFFAAVTVSGPLVSGLTVDGVTMQSSMFGFYKLATTGLDGTTITNSTFNDGYIGAAFLNDAGNGSGLDANDTTITNSNFTNLDTKGIYMETAQGDTLLDGITMNNVGQYGSVPGWGANGRNGVGININLKYHTYTGDLTISNFHLTDTGLSNGTATPVGTSNQAGAIVIEGRDDPASYNTIPADVSGLNVTVKDGIIDGTTSIGVRAGEFKVNPGDNVTGPAILIDNVAFNGVTTVSTIDNHTNSLMTVNGTGSNDVLRSAMMPGSTGPMIINGLGGADTLQGGLGDDTLNGGAGNDTLYSSGGIDVLDGGADIDTADFSPATNGVKVSLASTAFQNQNDYGLVKVLNIENLAGSAYADVLTGNSADNTILGMGGNDRLVASAGKDILDGGAGNDTADFSAFGGGVNVNLAATGFQIFNGTDQVKLISIENLIGGNGADTLKGDANNNILIGGGGDDILQGFGGTLDIFQGGQGDDLLTGTNAATTDVAYYTGRETEYAIAGSLGGLGVTVTDSVLGRDGTDTLNRIDRVKFLSPGHVSDVDNNGASDLIFQDSATGQITVVTQTAGTSNLLAGSPASNWRAVGTGLFNPDGAGLNARKSGILLQDNATGDMQIMTSISGPSSVTVALSSPTGAFTGFTALSAGDFNGDAASDILLWNNATQTAEIAFLNVNPGETVGTVSTITTVTGGPTGGSWAPIASGDFNGDGKSDILWQNGIGGAVKISLMNGASVTNTDSVVLNTGPGYKAVATGDFNNDGKSDIVFAVGGTAEIWTMNGDFMTNSNTYLAPTSGANGAGTFTLKGAENVNGDGYSDLLWQNAANGDVVATQLTTGNAILSTVNLTAPASNFTLIASSGGG